MMIALATILSFIKLVDLPYGGSITIASMLPILIIAQRYGFVWGFLSGCVHGAVQLVFGLSNLSYFSTWQSVVAIIVLDYILAFALISAGAATRGMKSSSTAMCTGAVIAGAVRYICHVISGATVWAGLSIPTTAALAYSFGYNATYMVPETIVLAICSYFIASSVNFRSEKLTVQKTARTAKPSVLNYISLAVASAALVVDTVLVFSPLQNPETGDFDITALADVNWLAVIITTAAAAVIALALYLVAKKKNSSSN